MKRKTWFNLHNWCGLNLSLLMSFVLITGTFATISPELDWLTFPESRIYSTDKNQINWGKIYESAQGYNQDIELLNIEAPVSPWLSATVIASENGKRFRIFIDPVTGEIQGTGRWYNWQRFFRQTHRHLMLPVKIGVTIVGLLSIPLLITLYSGTVIYRRWWQGFFENPFKTRTTRKTDKNTIKSRRFLWGNLHRWLGVWSLWFIFLIAITGAWYFFEQWGFQHRYPPLSESVKPETQISNKSLSSELLNTFVKDSKSLLKDFRAYSVILPNDSNGLLRIRGQSEALLVRPRANQVTFRLDTQEMIESRDGTELSIHGRISEAADPLHFGTFGGWVTRFIWFLFGLAMSTLSVSGVYLYGLRIFQKQENSQPLKIFSYSLKKINFLRWPSTILIVSSLVLAAVVFI